MTIDLMPSWQFGLMSLMVWVYSAGTVFWLEFKSRHVSDWQARNEYQELLKMQFKEMHPRLAHINMAVLRPLCVVGYTLLFVWVFLFCIGFTDFLVAEICGVHIANTIFLMVGGALMLFAFHVFPGYIPDRTRLLTTRRNRG